MPAITKEVTGYGNRLVMGCDGQCNKAWGRNQREIIEIHPSNTHVTVAITNEELQRNAVFENLAFTPEQIEQSESRIHSRRLMEFAKATLRIMESHKEWDADTTEAIQNAAFELGVADCDETGHFRVKETPA